MKYQKKKDNKYLIFLDNNESIELYEDIILKYELLYNKILSKDKLDEIINDNKFYDLYYYALNILKRKNMSVYELRKSLFKNNYEDNDVEKVIDKLVKQGYLNDVLFSKSFINNRIVSTDYGPKKIESELLNKGIDKSIIDNELEMFTFEVQNEKLNKLVKKSLSANHNKGGVVLKRKIINFLISKGYDYDLCKSIVEKYDFSIDQELAKKEYEKLKKKYSSKYNDNILLENFLKKKLLERGLVYEEE